MKIKILVKIIILVHLMMQSLTACKLWAICAKSSNSFTTFSESELGTINDQLTSFYYQSETMLDGWALLGYSEISSDTVEPLCRSNIPATEDSTLYWNTVSSLLDIELGNIGIGHLRMATSGTGAIPNPHPWMFYHDNKSFSLAHNGTVNKDLLYNLITENGSDMSWLESNPPQSFGGGYWRNDGWGNVVDSELILLLIMQKINASGDILSGMQLAIIDLLNEGVSANQLNIIFSDGSTIFIFGGTNGLYLSESLEHYSIMTYPENSGQNNWVGLQNEEMITVNHDGIIHYPDFVSTGSGNDMSLAPESFSMHPAYPNPFNSSVNFVLEGNTSEQIEISIFAINGNKIENFLIPNLVNKKENITWSPSINVASGTYIVRASIKNEIETGKILFIK